MTFHDSVLSPRRRAVLEQVGPWFADHQFYLAGGTALALHLGHRTSIDLDWFTNAEIGDGLVFAQRLRAAGFPVRTESVGAGTFHGQLAGVRVTALEYPYPTLLRPLTWRAVGCRIAALPDITTMKLAAIVDRGAKKDFVDLYALLVNGWTLRRCLRLYRRRYGIKDVGYVLHSLSYFVDADQQRMPQLLWRVTWREIKRTIQQAIKDFGR